MGIKQGDSGTIVEFTIYDDSGIVDLSLASQITATILKSRNNRITKTCDISDAKNGKCQMKLTSDDTSDAGNYAFQVTVAFSNGDTFSSDKNILTIDSKL